MALWTLVGGTLRLWSLRRLGLVHFDEGIYAIAGLVGLDPSVIPYAPPGFPFLIGLAYDFLVLATFPPFWCRSLPEL